MLVRYKDLHAQSLDTLEEPSPYLLSFLVQKLSDKNYEKNSWEKLFQKPKAKDLLYVSYIGWTF